MIQWFNKIKEQRQEANRNKRLAKLQETRQQRLAQIKETQELRLIAINNVRYIKSAINVFNSVVNTIKGQSAAETKRRRATARIQLEWYKSKLPEEEVALIHWEKKLKTLAV